MIINDKCNDNKYNPCGDLKYIVHSLNIDGVR